MKMLIPGACLGIGLLVVTLGAATLFLDQPERKPGFCEWRHWGVCTKWAAKP